MMRSWSDTYAKAAPAVSSATISLVLHALIVAAWVYATLPATGVPSDSLANRLYPAYIPPPDHVPGQSGSRESVHYVTVARDEGTGNGDGPRMMGEARPVTADESVGRAPIDSSPAAATVAVPGPPDSVFTVLDVDSAVVRSGNSAAPAYPLKLLTAHVMGYVTARYVVDTTGFADSSSFEVLKATHAEFEVAVRTALPYMRFKPAKIGAMKVRQLVEQMFSFKINDTSAVQTRKPTP
jgi:hypothetical protein